MRPSMLLMSVSLEDVITASFFRRFAQESAAGELGLRLHLAVHDSGIGIAAEHLPRLFHSFI